MWDGLRLRPKTKGEEVEAVGLLYDALAERERRLDELRTTLERKDEDMEGLRGNIELMQQQMLLLREAAIAKAAASASGPLLSP